MVFGFRLLLVLCALHLAVHPAFGIWPKTALDRHAAFGYNLRNVISNALRRSASASSEVRSDKDPRTFRKSLSAPARVSVKSPLPRVDETAVFLNPPRPRRLKPNALHLLNTAVAKAVETASEKNEIAMLTVLGKEDLLVVVKPQSLPGVMALWVVNEEGGRTFIPPSEVPQGAINLTSFTVGMPDGYVLHAKALCSFDMGKGGMSKVKIFVVGSARRGGFRTAPPTVGPGA